MDKVFPWVVSFVVVFLLLVLNFVVEEGSYTGNVVLKTIPSPSSAPGGQGNDETLCRSSCVDPDALQDPFLLGYVNISIPFANEPDGCRNDVYLDYCAGPYVHQYFCNPTSASGLSSERQYCTRGCSAGVCN